MLTIPKQLSKVNTNSYRIKPIGPLPIKLQIRSSRSEKASLRNLSILSKDESTYLQTYKPSWSSGLSIHKDVSADAGKPMASESQTRLRQKIKPLGDIVRRCILAKLSKASLTDKSRQNDQSLVEMEQENRGLGTANNAKREREIAERFKDFPQLLSLDHECKVLESFIRNVENKKAIEVQQERLKKIKAFKSNLMNKINNKLTIVYDN